MENPTQIAIHYLSIFFLSFWVHICRVKGWKHVWKPDPSPVRPIIWHAVSLWKHNQCMTSSGENRGRFYSMGMLRRAPHELQGFDHHAVCSVVLRPHRMHASRRFEWKVFVSQDWTIPSSTVCWRFQPLTTWLDNTIRLSNWSTVSIPRRDSKQGRAWRLEVTRNQPQSRFSVLWFKIFRT